MIWRLFFGLVGAFVLVGCHASGSFEDAQPYTPSAMAKKTRELPESHHGDWIKRHALSAQSGAADCMDCHREQDCVSCHNEQAALPYRVHPPNFVVVHSVDARMDTANCTSCHQVETFCATCHIQANIAQIPPSNVPARLQFHPPGWLDANSPANHGKMARRNISDCASCHIEQDCVTCHIGINPHPPEFRLDCGNWLRANPQPCAQCHGNMTTIQMLCN